MASILCDCGCGVRVIKPVFYSNACRMRTVRGNAHSSNSVRRDAQETTKYVRSNAQPVREDAQEYEYVDNGNGKKIRRQGQGDWEIQHPTTGKWVAYAGD